MEKKYFLCAPEWPYLHIIFLNTLSMKLILVILSAVLFVMSGSQDYCLHHAHQSSTSNVSSFEFKLIHISQITLHCLTLTEWQKGAGHKT